MAGDRSNGHGAYRSYWNREQSGGANGDPMDRSEATGGERLADDPRAVEAADQWRRRYGREGYEGSYAQHDEPYRRFRERHIQELDRDYEEWCREQAGHLGGDDPGRHGAPVSGSGSSRFG
jgi:hypothetical protein